jgi:hypothetical protein
MSIFVIVEARKAAMVKAAPLIVSFCGKSLDLDLAH